MSKTNSAPFQNTTVFYDGPSQLTGRPIVGVLSGLTSPSVNAKTGSLLQAWVLVRDEAPGAAIDAGRDDAVCGDCALRGEGRLGRACYVTYWQGPFNVWRMLPHVARWPAEQLGYAIRDQRVRLGAYGDPTAIPADVWQALLARTAGAIGYTQQWRTCAPAYREFLMASVLSTIAAEEARAAGWRTYRIRGPLDQLLAGEIVCPASGPAPWLCNATALVRSTMGAPRGSELRQAGPAQRRQGGAARDQCHGLAGARGQLCRLSRGGRPCRGVL